MAAMKADIPAAEVALRFRFTTSSPPNCLCLQSARTAAVSGPWNPTIITAPISSSSVRPPGPSCSAGDGLGEGGGCVVGEGVGVGVGEGACEVGGAEHEASNAAKASTEAMLLTRPAARDPCSRSISNNFKRAPERMVPSGMRRAGDR
jgi:hypothetical protein